ncbi:hypothetical protein RJ639_031207 [Escallonia herrerae]|uniref:VQ domain-containing protein n=1 Tax=Escallonia herrerae TaxID=1293975 RepID=A0AA88XDW5_9ASTE|nr:hypothetical protein RJ639_031207 [Escallonia herrerae]
MKTKMKPQAYDIMSTPSKFSVQNSSHLITKIKPKIRIIHIVAPEIITTDVANFRELVQRLTGKPARDSKGSTEKASRSSAPPKSLGTYHSEPSKLQDGIPIFPCGDGMKKEPKEEMYMNEVSSGFFSGFGDMDGFVQDLSQFPLLPFKSPKISIFGELPFCL